MRFSEKHEQTNDKSDRIRISICNKDYFLGRYKQNQLLIATINIASCRHFQVGLHSKVMIFMQFISK